MLEVQNTLEGEFREMGCQEEDKEGAQHISQSRGLGPNVERIIAEEDSLQQRFPRRMVLTFKETVKEAA